MASGNQQGARMVRARKLTLGAVLVAVIISLAFDSGVGTPSSFGIGQFFLLCPLGGLEAMIASRSFIPVAAISMGVVLIIALFFGRFWCAWGCPAPVIRHFFKRDPKPRKAHPVALGNHGDTDDAGDADGHAAGASADGDDSGDAGSSSALIAPLSDDEVAALKGCAGLQEAVSLKGALKHVGKDSRTWVLVGVLIATLIAGLPLFCLICPIGLTFGTVGSLWHLIVDKQVTLSCVVFPAALLIELVAMRRWCLDVCPIAGLLAIFGQFGKLLRPKVNHQTCLRSTKGVDCTVCAAACPEQINLHEADTALQLAECSRCGQCAAQCPTSSIAFHK